MRLHNAAEALLAAREQYRGQIAPADSAVPGLYAGIILAEDDRHGTACGLVVQGDQSRGAASTGWKSLPGADSSLITETMDTHPG
jgi:hypothetical protein